MKNILNYKKPALWISICSVCALVVLAVILLTNPKTVVDTEKNDKDASQSIYEDITSYNPMNNAYSEDAYRTYYFGDNYIETRWCTFDGNLLFFCYDVYGDEEFADSVKVESVSEKNETNYYDSQPYSYTDNNTEATMIREAIIHYDNYMSSVKLKISNGEGEEYECTIYAEDNLKTNQATDIRKSMDETKEIAYYKDHIVIGTFEGGYIWTPFIGKKHVFASYEDAANDSGNDVWFSELPGEPWNTMCFYNEDMRDLYCYVDCFSHCYEIYQCNVNDELDNFVFSWGFLNMQNQRTYVNENEIEFNLVDDAALDKTYVLICYDKQYGYISFTGMTDEEIHEILDEVEISV